MNHPLVQEHRKLQLTAYLARQGPSQQIKIWTGNMQEAGAKSTAQALRGEIREAKTQLELKLVRAIKGSRVKRDTYRYNMGPQVGRRHSSDRQHRKGWSNQHHFLQELSHVNHAPWPLHVSAQAEKRRALWELACIQTHGVRWR